MQQTIVSKIMPWKRQVDLGYIAHEIRQKKRSVWWWRPTIQTKRGLENFENSESFYFKLNKINIRFPPAVFDVRVALQ